MIAGQPITAMVPISPAALALRALWTRLQDFLIK